MYSDLKYNEVTAFYKLSNPNFFPVVLTSKLQRMYLVYGSANVMLTKNCHKFFLLSVYLAYY